MKLLLREVRIIDPESTYHDQTVDLYIVDGQLAEVGSGLEAAGAQVHELAGYCVSPGWLDLGAQVGDPGQEQREDLTSLRAAAAAGGYTRVAVLPNTEPALHSKSEISYIQESNRHQAVQLHPLGAISRNAAGQELTEMVDMYHAGALAFTDGIHAIQHAGLLQQALLYVKSFGGLVLNHPFDESVGSGGQMHEGRVSTSLGMRGLPTLSETLMLERDLHLLAYTESRLHVHQISSAAAVAQVRAAKARGLPVTASVPALNLLLTDESLTSFDSHLKVFPPLRTAADRDALREAVADGTIDCITANHAPHDTEAKEVEFSYAAFGATGLETAFGTAWHALHEQMTLTQLVQRFCDGPRRLLGLPLATIALGQPAELTVFAPDDDWTVRKEDLFSKSHNTPLLGTRLHGSVKAIYNNGQWRTR